MGEQINLNAEEKRELAEAVAAEQVVADLEKNFNAVVDGVNELFTRLAAMTGGLQAAGPVAHYRALATQKLEEFLHRAGDCRAVLAHQDAARMEAISKAASTGKIVELKR